MTPDIFRANLEQLEERIRHALTRAGRQRDKITLVVVSKTQPPAFMESFYQMGVRDFGENRTEEALTKFALFPPDVRWHMIGHIQSRRAREAVQGFHLIHSVDRLDLARELQKRASAIGVTLPILLQVNVSGEESKSGFQVTSTAEADAFLPLAAQVAAMSNLSIQGLMTMAPFEAEPAETRPVFVALRRLRERLAHDLPAVSWGVLSMGMTNDFEIAIEEGATHIRVGTALFGARNIPH